MPIDSNISRFFAEVQATMRLRFRGWERDIPHPGEKGGIRERRVADFLSSILPQKYGIGTGHVIDSEKEPLISHQTDIVIYDAVDGIVLPVDDYYSLFPCESVYAVIEVKSKLDASDGDKGPKGEIFKCVKSTTCIKKLNRSKHNLPPIHSIVFAYETVWSNNQVDYVKKWFESFGEKYAMNLPEVVLVLEPGFVLGTSGPSGYNDKGEFTNIYERDPLLYFASDLIYRLSQTGVAIPNLWQEYINWSHGEVITKTYE